MQEIPRTNRERITQLLKGASLTILGSYAIVIGGAAAWDGLEVAREYTSTSRDFSSNRWTVEHVVPFGLADDIVRPYPQDERTYRMLVDGIFAAVGAIGGGVLAGGGIMEIRESRRRTKSPY